MIAVYSSCVLLVTVVVWRVLNWVWFRPKNLEKRLKEQGFNGNPYKLLYGDFKEMSTLFREAYSKPINLSDDVVPRSIPHFLGTVKKYGKKSYQWFGLKPTVLIMDPELIKEVTQKNFVFKKPHTDYPFVKLLLEGILVYEGDKWSKQRKLLNPVFHVEKLKLMFPTFHKSASEMLTKWENIVSPNGSIEVDVWPNLQTLTAEAISRTAFGSNYEEGRKIFELQREQAEHVIPSTRSLYVPGFRLWKGKRTWKVQGLQPTFN